MTCKEFWKIKVGDIIKDDYHNFIGRVIKREISDEIAGMFISKHTTTHIKTDRKILSITLDTRDIRITKSKSKPKQIHLRYLNSNDNYKLSYYSKVTEKEAYEIIDKNDIDLTDIIFK